MVHVKYGNKCMEVVDMNTNINYYYLIVSKGISTEHTYPVPPALIAGCPRERVPRTYVRDAGVTLLLPRQMMQQPARTRAVEF